MKGKPMKIFENVINLLFPLRCPVCDDIARPSGEKICLGCMRRLEVITPPRCCCCGKKIMDAEKEYCHDCTRSNHKFKSGRVLYRYESAASGIYRFKYGNRREYADFYGEEIARYLGGYIRGINPDGLVPVPLHPGRQRVRGYNQAELLAHAVSRYTGIPVYDRLIRRIRNTVPLKQLNPVERQNNLKKAFNIIRNDVKLNTIILIDDIYTTGSTMDEMSDILLESGIERVYFITLAGGAGL